MIWGVFICLFFCIHDYSKSNKLIFIKCLGGQCLFSEKYLNLGQNKKKSHFQEMFKNFSFLANISPNLVAGTSCFFHVGRAWPNEVAITSAQELLFL